MGKPKYIETPEKMWELFLKYAEETKSKPILVQDFVGKDGDEVYRKKERPLTLDGFSIWLFKNDIISEVWQYFSNLNGAYNDYLGICRAIKEYIRTDQIEGGMAGIYNPSITQRLNGLTEKADVTLREQPIFKGINLDVTEDNGTE